MVAGHRDDDIAGCWYELHVPRAGELDAAGRTVVAQFSAATFDGVVCGTDHVLFAGAGDSRNFAGVEVEAAQCVVDGVGDDHVVADLGSQLRAEFGHTAGL